MGQKWHKMCQKHKIDPFWSFLNPPGAAGAEKIFGPIFGYVRILAQRGARSLTKKKKKSRPLRNTLILG